jgi:all-trans-retinol 13,14-reductase
MKRGPDYEAFKTRLGERLQGVVEAYVPAIRGRIRHAELSTPLTTAHFAGYSEGEIYGIDHAPDRFRARWLRPATPIRGLYLTGQDISTCGVAGAMIGGVLTASAILRRNLLGAIVRRRRRPQLTAPSTPRAPSPPAPV